MTRIMKKKQILQNCYDMACHNLFCYSKNYLMDTPKEGYEKDWAQAQEECELLQEMIKEMAAPEIAAQKQPDGYIKKSDFIDCLHRVYEKLGKELESLLQEQGKSLNDLENDDTFQVIK